MRNSTVASNIQVEKAVDSVKGLKLLPPPHDVCVTARPVSISAPFLSAPILIPGRPEWRDTLGGRLINMMPSKGRIYDL